MPPASCIFILPDTARTERRRCISGYRSMIPV